MQETKFCKGCGLIISRIDSSDWYSHMSIKYCPECRRKSDRQKSAERMKEFRKRQRAFHKAKDERLKLYEEENELLRKMIIRMREGSI